MVIKYNKTFNTASVAAILNIESTAHGVQQGSMPIFSFTLDEYWYNLLWIPESMASYNPCAWFYELDKDKFTVVPVSQLSFGHVRHFQIASYGTEVV